MERKRSVRREIGQGAWKFYNAPTETLPPRIYYEKGECMTFNHDLSLLGRSDCGGPFWSNQSRYESEGNNIVAQGLGRVYEGTLHTSNTVEMYGSIPAKPSNFDSLVSAGTTAIARTVPTHPAMSGAVAIGELHQQLPHFVGSSLFKGIGPLSGRKLGNNRDLADEYLNLEFGWKPMVSDLKKFASQVRSKNKTLRQLYRDSGANNTVRRRYEFPIQTSSTVPTDPPIWGWVPPFRCDGGQLDSWMLGSGPQPTGYRLYSTTETRTWFTGAYSYIMPDPPKNLFDQLDKWDAEASKLFGTRLTPQTLWNLQPWSWAADWFTNIGDVYTNFSALGSDSLAIKWGFIMRDTRTMDHGVWQGYINHPDGTPHFVTAREATGSQQKVRLRATPFGFGIDVGSFSPRQIAIATSLGVTRAPRVAV